MWRIVKAALAVLLWGRDRSGMITITLGRAKFGARLSAVPYGPVKDAQRPQHLHIGSSCRRRLAAAPCELEKTCNSTYKKIGAVLTERAGTLTPQACVAKARH